MEDNDKDDNNFKDISAQGLDRDLGFSVGHQGHRWGVGGNGGWGVGRDGFLFTQQIVPLSTLYLHT